MKQINTYDKILDAAEALLAKQGYHAFSYKDIANLVGIKTSSIHYHFPNKTDLGKKVIERHSAITADYLNKLNGKKISPEKKLLALIDTIINGTYHNEKRMCLGAMIAIDALTMEPQIIKAVKQFFVLIESWIEALLATAGLKETEKSAKTLMAHLEGTLLLSRLFSEQKRIGYLKNQVSNLFK